MIKKDRRYNKKTANKHNLNASHEVLKISSTCCKPRRLTIYISYGRSLAFNSLVIKQVQERKEMEQGKLLSCKEYTTNNCTYILKLIKLIFSVHLSRFFLLHDTNCGCSVSKKHNFIE